MSTPSNRYMNTSGWGFTPSGGSNTTITGITNASYDEGISTKKEGADFDAFPTFSVRDFADPKVTIESLDAMALNSVLAGAKGTLVGNLRDVYNGVGVGGGGKLMTFSNCQIEQRGFGAPYREYARLQLVFGAISIDGATHPMAITSL